VEEIASLGKVIKAKPVLLGREVAGNRGVTFLSIDDLEKMPHSQKLETLLK